MCCIIQVFVLMSGGITGPESVSLQSNIKKNVEEVCSTHNRIVNRRLIKDNNAVWKTLQSDYGFKLNPKPKKARSPASGSYVLEAVRGTGRKKWGAGRKKKKKVFITATQGTIQNQGGGNQHSRRFGVRRCTINTSAILT